MTTSPTRIELYYDVVSPYSWFAFEVLCRYRNLWNMDLKLVPFRIGEAMKATGNKPPWMSVPAKNKYVFKDAARSAAFFSVPLKSISDLYHILVERGSFQAQKFLIAISLNCPQYLEEASRQLWSRIWSKGEDIVENESLRQAGQSASMPADEIEKCISMIDDPSVVELLGKNSKTAIDHGAFGAPTIIVHTASGPEMFFGADRFEMIAGIIGEQWKGPIPASSSL